MWQVMRIYGIGGRVLKGIMSFYDEGRACVRVGNVVSLFLLMYLIYVLCAIEINRLK